MKKDKITASLYLSAYCDKLGYLNGDMEFNFNYSVKNDINKALSLQLYLTNYYLASGGTQMDLTDYIVSDDTLFTIATLKGVIKGDIKKEYVKVYDKINSEREKFDNDIRGSGFTTMNYLEKLKEGEDYKKFKYSVKNGGNGACMRSAPIGLLVDDLDEIIKLSIDSGKMTHNYIIGYLGSFVNAYFTYLAMKNVEPWKWADHLLKVLNDGKIDSYIKKNYDDYDQYKKEKQEYIEYWLEYKEKRLDKFEKQKIFIDPKERFTFLMSFNPRFKEDDFNYSEMGSSGLDCCIIALDSIIMSLQANLNREFNREDPSSYHYNTESFFYYACVHFGDSDTTGAVAGAWLGALTGKTFNVEHFIESDIKKTIDKCI